MGCLFARLDGQRVQHLDRGRDNAGGDDVTDRVAGVFGAGKVSDERPYRLGLAEQANGDFGHDAQRAFRADDQGPQVRPEGVQRIAAQGDDAAVWADERQPEDVIGGKAVLQAVSTAGVLRDVAANRAHDLAGWVRREVEVILPHGSGDAGVGDPRLHDRALIVDIHAQDAPHARQADDDAMCDRECSPRQAGAGATGNEGDALTGTHPHHGGDLFSRGGQHDQGRHYPEPGQTIALVGA